MMRLLLPAALCLLAVPVFAQPMHAMPDTRTVSVTGEGEVSVEPDQIVITLGVETFAPNVEQATAELEERSGRLLETIKDADVADKDVQTTGVRVSPRYDQRMMNRGQDHNAQPQIVGFTAARQYQVTLRDPRKLQVLLQEAVTAGANTVYGLGYETSRRDELMAEARRKAVQNAREKAELLAGELGMRVGLPRRIDETGGGFQPPYPMAARMEADAGGRPTTALGEITVNSNVQVTFDMMPAGQGG